MKNKRKIKRIISIIFCLSVLVCLCGCGTSEKKETKKNKSTKKKSSTAKVEMVDPLEEIGKSKGDATTTEATTVETVPQSYESNEYYDIIEEAVYKNSIGYNHLIHKVMAKQDVTLESTVIVYDANGDVVGKSTDDICLAKGETNFFEYIIKNDISEVDLSFSVQEVSESRSTGPRNAVKMSKWNQSGNNLYITFEQVAELGSFAEFKILMYKEGKIVYSESGYFTAYASGLNGIGSTDVASIWIYDIDFDDIEYVFDSK